MVKQSESIEATLSSSQAALAKGDILDLEDEEEIDELLALFRLNLDRNSRAYRQLGIAILRKKVAALQALQSRQRGEPVETPRVAEPTSRNDAVEGSTLWAAFRRLEENS